MESEGEGDSPRIKAKKTTKTQGRENVEPVAGTKNLLNPSRKKKKVNGEQKQST